MATWVYPPLAPEDLRSAEDESLVGLFLRNHDDRRKRMWLIPINSNVSCNGT